ncbi:uncharacterized protein SAZU_1962 [Streptomyces azureus]|uniref:Uncharacterized protein n=1 Tax=Streptomyces azureus TaxID=146537 RepID=A0A0K8PH56_STRAJ|nr:uncharacterized protein SAZU_1962 [Streptomyces azureus]
MYGAQLRKRAARRNVEDAVLPWGSGRGDGGRCDTERLGQQGAGVGAGRRVGDDVLDHDLLDAGRLGHLLDLAPDGGGTAREGSRMVRVSFRS